MKAAHSLCPLLAILLAGCSTTGGSRRDSPDSETVMVTYHVKAGKEPEFQALLARAWVIYTTQHLVFTRPHLLVRDTEDAGKTRFVEILTWISRATPENAPDAVRSVWMQEQSLCERRDGHRGIEISEVEIVR